MIKVIDKAEDAEIFGLFIGEDHKNSGVEGALLNEILFELHREFGSQQEIIYFVEESSDDELSPVLAAGFTINDRTRRYSCILR